MPFPAKAIANCFLDQANHESYESIHIVPNTASSISPMKLLNLVYFAHGCHLALTDQPLVKEPIEAWHFGPIISTLYNEFKIWGNSPILKYATHVDNQGKVHSSKLPNNITKNYSNNNLKHNLEADFARSLIEKVWQIYGVKSSVQLANLSHDPQSPWAEQINCNNCNEHNHNNQKIIANWKIKNYFKTIALKH